MSIVVTDISKTVFLNDTKINIKRTVFLDQKGKAKNMKEIKETYIGMYNQNMKNDKPH